MSEALARALLSLEGLSIGDAFGERLCAPDAAACVVGREIPPGTWAWTDDTEMALSLVARLYQQGRIEQDALAWSFAHRCVPARGYSRATAGLLGKIAGGKDWKCLSSGLYGGCGSLGNGAAMRVAPLGAYFAHDIPLLLEQARLSAEITHTHPEAIAGAQAVAIAAALAVRSRSEAQVPALYLREVAAYLPASEVRARLLLAAEIDAGQSERAVQSLGCGERVCAQDTVPYALWCAAHHQGDYAGTLWDTAAAGGDRDTLCAIAGGVVALNLRGGDIPVEFRAAREGLPTWFLSVMQ